MGLRRRQLEQNGKREISQIAQRAICKGDRDRDGEVKSYISTPLPPKRERGYFDAPNFSANALQRTFCKRNVANLAISSQSL